MPPIPRQDKILGIQPLTAATESTAFIGKTGKKIYWVNQRRGVEYGGETWIQRLAVCASQPGDGQTRFGGVPADPSIRAYVYRPIFPKLIGETMVFCPVRFDNWTTTETSRTASGLHYRNLHVDIGSHPTDAQKAATSRLLADADFDEQSETPIRATKWLSDFLVGSFIHESTHATAFTGEGKNLSESYSFSSFRYRGHA